MGGKAWVGMECRGEVAGNGWVSCWADIGNVRKKKEVQMQLIYFHLFDVPNTRIALISYHYVLLVYVIFSVHSGDIMR